MATPPILDDAAPGDAPDADADALLAWPEICDLMNLQAPDAWRPRHAAVLAVRRRAQDEGGLDGRPPDLFSFLAKESRDLRSASEASAAALGASDSTALVALRFPAKPKRAGDKRIPLRERMAAAELR